MKQREFNILNQVDPDEIADFKLKRSVEGKPDNEAVPQLDLSKIHEW